ncbi:serine/threonine protein kinase [Penicillium concentricum]|uniref:Serine/threonine protein kinase n=1 Tax=Penicillium concentricum TaxID=293559 RepID=A0A9W9V979_9EURO|nr:serine/threonine protein kinase [Penicillium concentricum]KAJ5373452.1 serine/threonine protein kinase [Penicillium concentricum]
MSEPNRQAFVDDIVAIEKRIFDLPFASMGSLYFKRDLPTDLQGQSRTTEFGMGGERRAALDLDIGRCMERSDTIPACYSWKELQWTDNFGKPVECFPYSLEFLGAACHHDYLALRKYMAVAPYLLPKDPGNVSNRPALRHPGISPCVSYIDTFRTTSIIDWQHAVIVPLSPIAGHPKMFQHSPPASLENLEPGTQPLGYAEMDPQEKAGIDYHLQMGYLSYRYRVSNSAVNKLHLEALRDPLVFLRQQLVEYSGRQWWGDLTTLRGVLMYLNDIWDEVPGRDASPESPIRFSEEEVQDYEKKPNSGGQPRAQLPMTGVMSSRFQKIAG